MKLGSHLQWSFLCSAASLSLDGIAVFGQSIADIAERFDAYLFRMPAYSNVACAGIQDMLERVAKEKGMVWEDFFAKLKKNEQWHVEVY